MTVHVGQRGPGHQARAGWSEGASGASPDPFDLGEVTAAALATTYESATILVTGLAASADLTVAGGEYAINGGAWASAPATVTSGDAVKVRGVSSSSAATSTNVVLTIGGVSDGFILQTVANEETSAFIARLASDPGATRRGQMDALVGALKSAGLWPKIDVLQVYAAHDAEAALLNWKGASYAATPVGSPAFTPDRGFAGDGVAAHLDLGFANTTSAANWQASSGLGTFAVGVNIAGAEGATNFVLGLAGSSSSIRFNPYNGSAASGRFFQSSNQTFVNGAGRVGRYLVTRDATTQTGYRNGVTMSSGSVGSLTVAAPNLAVLRTNSTFSDSGVSFVMIGGGAAIWTPAEAAEFDAAMQAYLEALGAD